MIKTGKQKVLEAIYEVIARSTFEKEGRQFLTDNDFGFEIDYQKDVITIQTGDNEKDLWVLSISKAVQS